MRKLKFIILLAALLIGIMYIPAASQATGILPDLEGRTITVAVENAYPPFNYIDTDTSEAAGWDYDVLNEVCARLNCTLEFVETSWDGMIQAVSNSEFDMAADGITITAERDEIVDYSIPYTPIAQKLLVRIDEDRFATPAEFAVGDYKVAVQIGTTNYTVAVNLVGEERVIGLDQFGAAVQAVIAGDADAVVIDSLSGLGYVSESADAIRLIEEPVTTDEELGFIFPNDSDLVHPVNVALLSMLADGTLNDINAAHGLDPMATTFGAEE